MLARVIVFGVLRIFSNAAQLQMQYTSPYSECTVAGDIIHSAYRYVHVQDLVIHDTRYMCSACV